MQCDIQCDIHAASTERTFPLKTYFLSSKINQTQTRGQRGQTRWSCLNVGESAVKLTSHGASLIPEPIYSPTLGQGNVAWTENKLSHPPVKIK